MGELTWSLLISVLLSVFCNGSISCALLWLPGKEPTASFLARRSCSKMAGCYTPRWPVQSRIFDIHGERRRRCLPGKKVCAKLMQEVVREAGLIFRVPCRRSVRGCGQPGRHSLQDILLLQIYGADRTLGMSEEKTLYLHLTQLIVAGFLLTFFFSRAENSQQLPDGGTAGVTYWLLLLLLCPVVYYYGKTHDAGKTTVDEHCVY